MLDSQSGEPGVSVSESSPSTVEQITSFADQDAGYTTTLDGAYDSTMDLGYNASADISNFLSRPIRQSTQTWSVGAPLFYKFNPWTAFCENSIVRDKIKNYELLRMKLHMKAVVSGTQFHYGRAMVTYNPYIKDDQLTIERNFLNVDLVAASQKPHFFLNPASNQGGELEMPFMWHKNYLEIPAADWTDMGEVYIKSFGNLLHANLGNDPVNVTIYLWATDVVLTVPTSSDPPLDSQSGRGGGKLGAKNKGNSLSNDEYGTGIISKPAAAIAEAAGLLKNVPVIGPYMTATQVASNKLGQVAQIFGFSRPSIISNIVLQKPLPAGNMANTDAADACQKLTLDSKAELTIDSRTAGLSGEDEMGISEYVQRESYLTSFDWTPTQTSDELLWNCRVTPMLFSQLDKEIHMTPMAHMATAFESWQGSIKFRFQVVKSNFHKGRLLIRWDPNFFTSTVNYNTNYSRVVDIAEMEDFEVVIGWGQSAPWKNCSEPYFLTSPFRTGTRLNLNPNDTNGVLEVAVLNDLVSPSTDSSISVNVYVSACEDLKLAGPTNEKFSNYHLFKEPLASQSGIPPEREEEEGMADNPLGAPSIDPIIGQAPESDHTYEVYYGDPPCSIRELCKRYCYTRGWSMPAATADTMRINGLRNKNGPYFTGWDPTGVDEAAAGGTKLTVGASSFSNWFQPAYAGVRGAFRKKYLFENAQDAAPLVVRQGYKNADNGNIFSSELALAETTDKQNKYLSSRYNFGGGAGTATTNCGVNNTLEVELPYYRPHRFSPARNVRAQTMDCNSHQVRARSVNTSTQSVAPVVYQYDAVGEDYTLFGFVGVPIYYRYTLNETS
jgi:hypothetical protein